MALKDVSGETGYEGMKYIRLERPFITGCQYDLQIVPCITWHSGLSWGRGPTTHIQIWELTWPAVWSGQVAYLSVP